MQAISWTAILLVSLTCCSLTQGKIYLVETKDEAPATEKTYTDSETEVPVAAATEEAPRPPYSGHSSSSEEETYSKYSREFLKKRYDEAPKRRKYETPSAEDDFVPLRND